MLLAGFQRPEKKFASFPELVATINKARQAHRETHRQTNRQTGRHQSSSSTASSCDSFSCTAGRSCCHAHKTVKRGPDRTAVLYASCPQGVPRALRHEPPSAPCTKKMRFSISFWCPSPPPKHTTSQTRQTSDTPAGRLWYAYRSWASKNCLAQAFCLLPWVFGTKRRACTTSTGATVEPGDVCCAR